MATTVYHGTTIEHVPALQEGRLSGPCGPQSLYVTDTRDRAARYANAQATRAVDERLTVALVGRAVVVTLETDEDVTWFRRPESHATLDVAETTIESWRVVAIEVSPTIGEHCANSVYTTDPAWIDGRYLAGERLSGPALLAKVGLA